MVEIRYGDQFEVSDLAGQTVGEARELFKTDLGIPAKAQAKLNGSKVKSSAEIDTVLNDDDKLTFAVSHSRTPFLIGALLLALAVTGSVFAFGFINASASLTNVDLTDSNFADVSENATGTANISWTAYGWFKGAIDGPNELFDILPADNAIGDLVITVSLGNADSLVDQYRVLALQLEVVDANTGATKDINESGGAGDPDDWVMLTLDNGSVSMFTNSNNGDPMIVRIKSGFYITHVRPHAGWTAVQPQFFCEVAQR